MKLIALTPSNIQELMSWFTNESETTSWGGPHFNYPFDIESFQADLKLNELPSYGLLLEDKSTLLAFGQFYRRLGRCHLARLVVNPEYRGQGDAKQFITQLLEKGLVELDTSEASLYVYESNVNAIKLYKKLGFETTELQDNDSIKDCLDPVTHFV